jgi:predicted transcriptional regulator
MTDLRTQRTALRLSQSALSRSSGVPRPKICIFELGGGSLTADEQGRIREALRREAERFRGVTVEVDFSADQP